MYFFSSFWPVFHEDNHLLALYKPAGLLVQGDQSGDVCLLDMAKRWLKIKYAKPGRVYLGLVHRLDRPVAGIILFCRTSKAAARLSEQFRSRRVLKRYMALVEGKLNRNSGCLVHYLRKNSKERRTEVVPREDPEGQLAELSYRVLETSASQTLIAVEPTTGRRHQIRVQLAHFGFPIVGDVRYGASGALSQRQIALVATELQIVHPTLATTLTFKCPLPNGWPWAGNEKVASELPWNWREFPLESLSSDRSLGSA